MMGRLSSARVIAVAAATFVTVFSGCGQSNPSPAPQTAPDTSTTAPTKAPTPRATFEQDLEYVRNGQFTYVWVFARKDSKPLDKDDGDVLRKAAPHVVDWVTTDEGRKVIAGSNFDLELENWNVLRKRFVVEDYSGK